MNKVNFYSSAAVGLIFLFHLAASKVSAFDYTGKAWCCENDITYCVNPTEPTDTCGPTATARTFVNVVNDAAASWNIQGFSFQLVYGGTTSNTGCIPGPVGECVMSMDGQNVVSMATGCTLPAGILATTWWLYNTPSGNPDDCCILEADICVTTDATWFRDADSTLCSGCYDLESAMLHEFGHWASLGHEDDEALLGYRPSMYSTFGICEIRRAVTVDDAAGVDYIYGPKFAGNDSVLAPTERCTAVHIHPPYPPTPSQVRMSENCNFIQCDNSICPQGRPFCDSVSHKPCLLVCPKSDVVFQVVVKDSCGNPICDTVGTWLEWSPCPGGPNHPIPCPGEEPDWPRVYADSCNPATGVHYFTIDAGWVDVNFGFGCNVDCMNWGLYIDGSLCREITTRYLDLNGDLCVTDADFVAGCPSTDLDCDGTVSTSADSAIWLAHRGHCCSGGPCPPGLAWCDSVYAPPCLLVCPKSDLVYTVWVMDSCGNPVCDPLMKLDFSNCPAFPCPGEEPDWQFVFPDSCDPLTGKHYFNVDASIDVCVDCDVKLWVNGVACKTIPARFLDNNGDRCVTSADFVAGAVCTDFDCDGAVSTPADSAIWLTHFGHCCPGVTPCPPGRPFCDSIKHDPCLLVCPESDAVFRVVVKDSCGNPICDPNCWLEFPVVCPVFPCPGEETAWPRVYPDSCRPATGEHFFTVDASIDACVHCDVGLFVNGALCRVIPARLLDNNGDLCVTELDWQGPPRPCDDLNCDGTIDIADRAIWAAHYHHCCRNCPDADADGVCDPIDNCRLTPNPTQLDSDSDGLGNACDNCPFVFNPGQEDTNGDGIGDACCCIGIRGDVNGDGAFFPNILDLNYVVNYIFRGGRKPPCPHEADLNGDGTCCNILDLNFLVNYIFRGGPAPGPC